MADETKSLQVKVYLLSRTEKGYHNEWNKAVVAATSEKGARELVNQSCGDEGYVWTDGHRVEAKEIGLAGEDVNGIILLSKE